MAPRLCHQHALQHADERCVGVKSSQTGALVLLVGVHLRGGTLRFSAGDRPCSRHLRECRMKWLTLDCEDTVPMNLHSSS